jgi:hypothetical protein
MFNIIMVLRMITYWPKKELEIFNLLKKLSEKYGLDRVTYFCWVYLCNFLWYIFIQMKWTVFFSDFT